MADEASYTVIAGKRVRKSLKRLPWRVVERYYSLVDDLLYHGPVTMNWPNFSKIGENAYHCHLTRKWVACWRHDKGTITIEVYYVGSRENAPY